METIRDPTLPYIGALLGGRFAPGKTITIHGTTSAAAYRFHICLQCGPEILPRDDVALLLTVQGLEDQITLNSLHDGVWGEEELVGSSPIEFGAEFEIKLSCDLHQYKIVINNQHRYDFPQRIHCDCITHLAIDGDISVIYIVASTNAASRSEIGFNPTSRLGQPPPIVLHSPATINDDYELIHSTTTARTPLLDSLPPSYEEANCRRPTSRLVSDSLPPSYEEAVYDNQRGSETTAYLMADTPGDPPYPVGAPYPTGMPCPTEPPEASISLLPGLQDTDGSEVIDTYPSHPRSSRDLPYPTGDPYTAGMPCPSRPAGATIDLLPGVPNAYEVDVLDASVSESRTHEETVPMVVRIPLPAYADSSASSPSTSSNKKNNLRWKWTLIAIFIGTILGIFLGTNRHKN